MRILLFNLFAMQRKSTHKIPTGRVYENAGAGGTFEADAALLFGLCVVAGGAGTRAYVKIHRGFGNFTFSPSVNFLSDCSN